jgi:hypothetical protein
MSSYQETLPVTRRARTWRVVLLAFLLGTLLAAAVAAGIIGLTRDRSPAVPASQAPIAPASQTGPQGHMHDLHRGRPGNAGVTRPLHIRVRSDFASTI